MVWLNRQGGPQELGAGIVVGNQFLEEQEKTADILLIADLLQVVQICSHLFCLEVERADVALDLGVRSRDQIFILQIQFFEQLLPRPQTGEVNLDVPVGLESRE